MKALRIGTAAAAILALSSSAFADVTLTIQDGRVTLVAKDATVRQILMEWARIGRTTIVNVERIPGGPQTIELKNVPEAEALEILLRAISGYMAAPRAVGAQASTSVSQFDRIVVMPTTAAPKPPASAAAPGQQPVFAQPQLPRAGDDDALEQQPAGAPGAPARGPIFNQFPAPQPGNPQLINPATGQPFGVSPPGAPQPFNPAQTAPRVEGAPPPPLPPPPGVPTAPATGVAVPGMVVPAPTVPGQPAVPGQVIPPGTVIPPGVIQPGVVQPGVVQPGVVQPGQPRRPNGNESP